MAPHPSQHASTVHQARTWKQKVTTRCQIAWHVMQASTLAWMAHHPIHRASPVQERIWTQLATMRCQIALNVMQASTLASMAYRQSKRASTVRQASIWRQSATMR
jgi:hypothetical protein